MKLNFKKFDTLTNVRGDIRTAKFFFTSPVMKALLKVRSVQQIIYRTCHLISLMDSETSSLSGNIYIFGTMFFLDNSRQSFYPVLHTYSPPPPKKENQNRQLLNQAKH